MSCQKKDQVSSRVDTLPYYKDATFTPNWFETPELVPVDFHKISSFNLVNQMGESITNEKFSNKVYVADFFFTSCPGICPKMTSNMLLIQEAFKDNDMVELLSHSVMPEFDSVSVLKSYANTKGVKDNKWHLVTGEREEIYDLGRNYYFVEEDLGIDKTNNDFLHTENFVLIDQQGHIRGIFNGLNKSSVNQLIADIKTLI